MLSFLSRSKKSASSWGGARYAPYAFTEQGIYMLMTVLKGEQATAHCSRSCCKTHQIAVFSVISSNTYKTSSNSWQF